ncbi:uncharacterized protein [Ptychodera flava]|uniref:uncharacterized protein n=1 Tax=Ptychodera flava TaxID=63121 RepID=UPI00396A2598
MKKCKSDTVNMIITPIFGTLWLMSAIVLLVLAVLSEEKSFARSIALLYLPLVLACAILLLPFAWTMYKFDESPDASDYQELYRALMVCFGLLSVILISAVFLWPFILVLAYLIRVIQTDGSEETVLLIVSTLNLICWGIFMYGLTMLYEAEERRRLRIEPVEHLNTRERRELYSTVTAGQTTSDRQNYDVSVMFRAESQANDVNGNARVPALLIVSERTETS